MTGNAKTALVTAGRDPPLRPSHAFRNYLTRVIRDLACSKRMKPEQSCYRWAEMANKTTLKYKQKEPQPLPELVDDLVKRSVDALDTGKIKASVSDLVRVIHLRRKLFPATLVPKPPTWVDGW